MCYNPAMILKDVLNRIFEQLSAAPVFHGHGIDNAWDEAVVLVCYVLHLPVDSDDSVLDHPVSAMEWQAMQTLLQRRITERVPMAYLTQEAWFMGLPFYVDERVLIPRSPFAEWIERRFTPWLDRHEVNAILEIGTGSGCMAIAASYVFPKAAIDAVDISVDALEVAQQNVQKHAVAERVHLIQSNCFAQLTPAHQYDLIISNPPYVSQDEIEQLPEEYLHEPYKTALYAPEQGMAIVDTILREAADYMTEHAVLVVEVGYSDVQLMERYPDVPFLWLDCEFGGQGLFLLTRKQLEGIHVGK